MRFAMLALRGLAILIAVVVLILGGGYLWLRRSLPQTTGSLRVAGVAAPVQIVRDRDGVPHISAESEADALFGLGYAHAQDRLWQMEFQRRVGHGRLAEVLGEPALRTDRFLRTLGVGRAARSAYTALDAETKALLDAYVAGVNAYLDGRPALPVEFTILGFQPEPWRPEDVLVWAKMMSWDLGGNWSDELLRARLSARVGPEAAAQLMPDYTPDGPLILPPEGTAAPAPRQAAPAPALADGAGYAELHAIEAELEGLGLGGEFIGSNNWVIGGALTASGKPLLADDPHLGSQIPSIWYLAHIRGGAIDAIGASIPGLPGIVIGHNGAIAWGVTNTGPDVQDLYIERIDAQNRAEYRGAWEPVEVIPEVIKVKGGEDEELFVRVTRHGPIITDVTEGDGDAPLAFRWTSLDPTDNTLRAYLGINRAQSWEEFREALRSYHAPMQNFVYADVDGNIGYIAPGALPIRAAGDGRAPVPGWSGAHDWAGYVPFDELPQRFNPPAGYIVTANNRVVGDEYPHLLGTSWAAPYRAARIVELVEARADHSVETMAAIQADVVSLQAREILPYLLAITPEDGASRQALELLRGWDGTMAGDSAAAAVYQGFYYALPEVVFGDELRDLYEESYAGNRNFQAMAFEAILAGTGGPWCDDVNTPAAEGCEAMLARALAEGLEVMAEAQGGADPAGWRWDRVHRTMFPHNPFSNVASLRGIFHRSIPNGGDGFTVNVAPYRRSDLFNQYNVASYRHIVDLADLGRSRFMHTTGQSGNVLSPHYASLIEGWQRVDYLPMGGGPPEGGEVLTLTP